MSTGKADLEYVKKIDPAVDPRIRAIEYHGAALLELARQMRATMPTEGQDDGQAAD